MTHEGLAALFVVGAVVHLAVLGFAIWAVIDVGRMTREVVRMTRAVAGLVYQEEEKTRARLDELFGRGAR